MDSIKKKHEVPQFEVVVNKESNKKFFVASNVQSILSVHVNAWTNGWNN